MTSFLGTDFCLEVHPEPISICFINKKHFNYKCILGLLTECKSDDFLSITNDKDEFSFFIPKRVADIIQTNFLNQVTISPEDYTCLKIFYTNNIDGIDDTGIVKMISESFSTHDIPILYINSFNNNFILVPSYHYNNFIEKFNLIEH